MKIYQSNNIIRIIFLDYQTIFAKTKKNSKYIQLYVHIMVHNRCDSLAIFCLYIDNIKKIHKHKFS